MLKSLVIIMGIMILSGTGFLIYTVTTGLHRNIAQEQASRSTVLSPTVVDPPASSPQQELLFNDQFISTGYGFTLQEVTVQAERVVVRYLEQATGHIRVVVYSLRTGQRLGGLTFGNR